MSAFGPGPRAVLVTGGSGGLGASIARHLARGGADVAVAYQSNVNAAENVVRDIRFDGGRAIAVGGDVSNEAGVEALFDAAVREIGPIDGCVVNAGLQADAPTADMTLDDWRKVVSIDLDGAFLVARSFLRGLPANDARRLRARGSLLFVTSVHAWVPWSGHANYAAAKAGADMLMRTLAQEQAAHGVRVNAIAPGAIATSINRDVWKDDVARQDLLRLIPYGRLGEPDDIGRAAAWLMSDAADYVTGTTLTVDGGISLYPGFVGNG